MEDILPNQKSKSREIYRGKRISRKVPTRFGKKLFSIMEKNGWRIMDFAKKYGISEVTVYSWLYKDNLPKPDVLTAIARDANMSIDTLLDHKAELFERTFPLTFQAEGKLLTVEIKIRLDDQK